ncbi:MAG: lytic murein transglycosylase [Deltaproteobacteria bacterium]|nr:lytic murein transglycosylase [Deltaproteobacteria bacterium]MBW2658388.1 lytic murein transglycosylase [Deltaproteobacteria bacterium]
MHSTVKIRRWLVVLPVIFIAVLAQSFSAGAESGFERWIADFYEVASLQGVSRETYEKAFSGVTEPDALVLKKAAYQAEFTTKIWDYLDARVNPLTISKGMNMAEIHGATLSSVESRFGVRSSVLLAIWSMESSYGEILKKTSRLHYVPRALATLAYGDKKRRKFGRSQLVAALKILQAGDIDRDKFLGSWAGAMGHTQFIPTSYLAYGVDMDGNGRRDIWNSIPDALATAASLLQKNGWRSGKTWGYEVVTPAGGDRYRGQTETLVQWQKLGFIRPKGKSYPRPGDRAVLKMLAGSDGPSFLMLKNFFVLKRYNNADAYALAVGLLADRLAGGEGMVQGWPRPVGALDVSQKFEIQERLKKLGFYTGEVDGNLGRESKKAIRRFQVRAGLVEDGSPDLGLLEELRKKN